MIKRNTSSKKIVKNKYDTPRAERNVLLHELEELTSGRE